MLYHPLVSVLGAAIVAMVVVDAIVTTLLVSGAGPLSDRLTHLVGRRAMLSRMGVVARNGSIFALMVTILMWTLLMWLGWSLVFCGSEQAIVASDLGEPADFGSRVYFAGFTITTLGVGNYIPQGPLWQVLTVVAAANGFFILTICVTYIFAVVNALNELRSLGVAVGQMGRTPHDLVDLACNSDQSSLNSQLQTVTQMLQSVSVKTDSYPVLWYSQVQDNKHCFAIGVANLGEVGVLLDHAIAPDRTLPRTIRGSLRSAVQLVMEETPLRKEPEDQPIPDSPDDQLQQFPLRSDWREALQSDEVRQRRRRLATWLRWHHCEWKELYFPGDDE